MQGVSNAMHACSLTQRQIPEPLLARLRSLLAAGREAAAV